MKQFLEILNEKAKEAGVRIRLMSYEPDLIDLAAKEYESQFRQAAVSGSLPPFRKLMFDFNAFLWNKGYVSNKNKIEYSEFLKYAEEFAVVSERYYGGNDR